MVQDVVISLGGSLIVPDGIDYEYLKKFRQFVLDHAKTHRFYIICGGGKTARTYIEAANKITQLKPEDLDWIGIHATRLNAHLLRTIFHDIAFPRIIRDPNERIKATQPVVIAAGWKPGWSTDYDAVLIAKNHGIQTVINLTVTDFVYDKDPKKYNDVRPFKQISWEKYRGMVGDKWTPGLNKPFDPIASKEAQQNKLKVIIANGRNFDNLKKIIRGEPYVATTIS